MNEIPDGWTVFRFGDYIDVIRGASPRPKGDPRYFGGEIPWISIRDINAEKGKYLSKTAEGVTSAGAEKSRLLKKGSLILSNSGSVCIPKILKIDGCIHDGFVAFPNLNHDFDIDYFYYLFDWMRPAVINENRQGVTQVNLNTEIVRSFNIPLAPLNEQKRIADKLDRLLAKVDNCRERLDRIPLILKSFRRSVLDAATSGELTEYWRDSYGHNQKSEWQEYLIGELMIGKPRNGYSPKSVEFETPTKSLTLTATTSGKFKPQHFKYIDELIPQNSHLWLEPGDILIQRANTLEYVGVSAIYFGTPFTFIYPDLMMKCKANSQVTTSFLHYLLSSNEVRSYFRENATGTAGNMPKINQQTVISAPVIVPPIQEQQEIVRRVEKLFDFADRLEARYKTARAQIDKLTPALLTKAFQGELVPQDPTDEPAAALLTRIQQARANPENQPPKQPKTPRKPPSPKIIMLNRKDIKTSHLADILKNNGTLTAEALWNISKLSIDDFYDQLKDEELQGLLKETIAETSNSLRLLEAI